MYQLVSAIGKKYDGSRWSDAEIGDISMSTLYATYKYIWATLSNVFLDKNVALDLNLLRQDQRFNTQTFNQYLASIGNVALPTQDDLPEINTKYVRYADIWKAGYTVTPIHDTAAIDSPLPVSDKHHLQLTKSGLDYADFYNNCLVSVNGLYHFSDGNDTGIYVKDGMKSIGAANNNHLGMTSFKDVGQIKQIPITTSMIYKQKPEQKYCHQMYLDLGQSYEGKQVFIVVGGYLHLNDGGFFRQIGESQYLLDFDNYPLIDRYYQSKDLIDLSSLNLFEPPLAKSVIEVEQLMSDEAMLAMMALSQTFVVVLDSDEFFYEQQFIVPGTIPGLHVSMVDPIYPMIVNLGMLANYWPHPDDGQFALMTSNTLRQRRVYQTVRYEYLPTVSDQRRPNDPVRQSDAYFQIMGRDM